MKLKILILKMTGQQVSAEVLVDKQSAVGTIVTKRRNSSACIGNPNPEQETINQSAVGKINRPVGGNMWLDLK